MENIDFILGRVDVTEELDSLKQEEIEKKQEKENERIIKLLNNAGIYSRYHNASMEDYQDADIKRKEKRLEILNNWSKLKKGLPTLVFIGESGSGKTYLACAIGKKALLDGFSVRYIRLEEMMVKNSNKDTRDENTGLLKNVELLILDNLESSPLTDFNRSYLKDILDYRYERELPTILIGGDKISKEDLISISTYNRMFESSMFVKMDKHFNFNSVLRDI